MAPNDQQICAFDHWCGGDGHPCCNASYFGGDCNNGLVCNFHVDSINMCAVQSSGGGGGGISLCTGGQNPKDYCAQVTCLPGYPTLERATACTQESANVIIRDRHTGCTVDPSACS
jgi:hypothetical protein